MQFLNRIISRTPSSSLSNAANALSKHLKIAQIPFSSSPTSSLFNFRGFSNESKNGDSWGTTKQDDDDNNKFDWNKPESSWSTGLTKEHFDGESVGHQVAPGEVAVSEAVSVSGDDVWGNLKKELDVENRWSKVFIDGWEEKMEETSVLLKQVMEPGARGSYLKDAEKAEMYRLHKENPELYTVERLAKDYRIMRQRVHAILWLKEQEEEEEKKLGHPLDDSVELLLDGFPEFFISHDREFHVASLPYKPDFKVMPEGWDGMTRDPDEVHYEISKKEDDILHEEFLQKFNFNKMKFKGEVKVHKYSRRRPSNGWEFVVEKTGARGKRGNGGGWKFVSHPDGSTRPLNEKEKMYVKRETPRRRRRILP